MKRKIKEITDYDYHETTGMINLKKPLKLKDLGFKIPEKKPTQVVSIRFPTELLNQLKSISSELDIPYQGLVKLILYENIGKFKSGRMFRIPTSSRK